MVTFHVSMTSNKRFRNHLPVGRFPLLQCRTLICSCGQQDFHDLSMPATCCAHESGDPCFGRPGFIKSSVQLWWCLDLVSSLEMCGCWSTIPSPSIGHDDIVAKGVEHGFSLRHSDISSKTNDWIIMVRSCSHQHLFWGEPGNKGKTKVRRMHKPSKILLLRYTGERDGLSNQAGAWVWNSLELTCFMSISYNLWDLVRLKMNLQEPFGCSRQSFGPWWMAPEVPFATRNLAPAQPQHGRFAPRSAVATSGRQRMPGTAINLGTFKLLSRVVDQVISLKY